MSRKTTKKEFGPYRVNIQNTTIFEPVILTGFYTSDNNKHLSIDKFLKKYWYKESNYNYKESNYL